MQFCPEHWASLRKAIEDRGLAHLVLQGGEAAHARLAAELDGTADERQLDPLLRVHNMIMHRALEIGGLYLLRGPYCPLCELVKHTEHGADRNWIDGASDSVLEYCRELKIVPGVS